MPAVSEMGHLPWRISGPTSKVDEVANRCFYMIVMGKWAPGTKLPPVRQVEAEWSASRVTVLKAYGMLVDRGLVRHEPNGSFLVAEQAPERDFARDRIVLENLYEDVVARISEQTDLRPAGVLKMLAEMAEMGSHQNPEVAFVECSRAQASDHARELKDRFGIPVLPLTMDDVIGKRMNIPRHVKLVFTTAFHIDVLAGLREGGVEVVALPVEISPDSLAGIGTDRVAAVFLETDRDLVRRTEKDAVHMMGIREPQVMEVADIEGFLSEVLDGSAPGPPDSLYLVPQKAWERLDARYRQHDRVRAISCKLSDPAWPIAAGALRVPFGAIA